jgi:hypothetical protein
MNKRGIIVFACLALSCMPVRLAHAQKPGLPDLQKPALPDLPKPALPVLKDPMIFSVAHGGPDACGPGCSEWIAAEGAFDVDAEARFRRFLDSLNGRQLPIMFDSRGGIIGPAASIGRILRERRMTASVGETYPDACRTGTAAHPACRKIMQESHDVRARLRTGTGKCHSACFYAFIGASRRQVPSNALLGIHASRATEASLELARRAGGVTAAQRLAVLKLYVVQMGVEPGVVDLAYKTPAAKLHHLTRDEIAQYGIETRASFETSWMAYESSSPAKPTVMLKAVSRPRGADAGEFRTTHLRIACVSTLKATAIDVQRELAAGEIGVPAAVQIAVGNSVTALQQVAGQADGTDHHITVAERQFVRAALAQGKIVLVERFSPKDAPAWSRETTLSTKGLEGALRTDLDDCQGAAR